MKTTPSPYSPGHAFIDTFVAPTELFARFKTSLPWAKWGAVMLFAVVLLSNIYFFSMMSSQWLLDQQMAQAGYLSASERPQVEAMLKSLLPYTGIYMGISNVLAIVSQILLLGLAYWLLQSFMLRQAQFTLWQWVNVVIVCQLPWIANYLGLALLTLSAADHNLPLSMLEYASLNQLFLHLDPHTTLYPLASEINLFHFWSLGLVATAVHRCLHVSWFASIVFATIPYFMLAVAWAGIA